MWFSGNGFLEVGKFIRARDRSFVILHLASRSPLVCARSGNESSGKLEEQNKNGPIEIYADGGYVLDRFRSRFV